MRIEPFRAAVEEAALDDLKRRLARTRQPVWPEGGGWEFGIERETLAETLAYWQDGFDWRAVEARLNAWPQFRTEIDGIPVHFIHTRNADPDAPALVLTHGWPGSVLEFLDALPALSARAHVVLPHLPGYGFSSPVSRPVYSREVAGLWRRLMEALGYQRFVAQGGDWGSLVTCWLGYDHAQAVRAIHLNMLIMRPDMGTLEEPLDEAEQGWIRAMRRTVDLEGGYLRIQATKPQSLAVGLSDSPAGLCAWILEKFYGWPDAGSHLDRDLVLGNIALYWFTNTLASSAWMYATVLDRKHYMLPAGERIAVPTGMAHFPNDTYPMAPRRWLERIAPVARWTDMPRGGHFAAMEEPALFAEEVLAFLDDLED